MDPATKVPPVVEEWTREQVRQWLCEEVKVDQKYASLLYEEEVSGEELVCYDVKHLCDLGIRHGPAVKIINRIEALKNRPTDQPSGRKKSKTRRRKKKLNSDNEKTDSADHSQQTGETSKAVLAETVASEQLDSTRIDDKQKTHKPSVLTGSPKTNKTQEDKLPSTDRVPIKETENGRLVMAFKEKSPKTVTCQKEEVKPEELSKEMEEGNSSKSTARPETQLRSSEVQGASDCAHKQGIEKTCKQLEHSCSFYLFDHVSVSHRYIKGFTLAPETGPGNLVDPVHEYKFMGRTNDIDIIKKKFNKEVFRFAAGCLNSRTNGTIHFGVADSKEMMNSHDVTDAMKGKKFCHGEIVGISIERKDVIIDHFNSGIKSYFEDCAEEAKKCIRQPRFVEVLNPDNTASNRYVIEVDIVPNSIIVQGKTFPIQTLDEENEWKKSKGKSLFIRDGASTRDIYKNPKDLHEFMKKINSLDKLREQAEKRPAKKKTSDHGERLRSLLTHGGKTLDYDYFIVVTNKSYLEQLQHLQFLSALKLFCVLDFDPNSKVIGSCQTYRESRIANLHKPEQFKGDAKTFIKDLNLYTQTSWVFCNGREDLTGECYTPLEPCDWLMKRAGDVNDVISFLCTPGTLPSGRFLIIFLLLSTVEAMTDPIFETFIMFYQRVQRSERILSLCTSQTAFETWSLFTKARCGIDMANESILHLELSEINGTLLELEQHSQTSDRFLPCAGGGSVILGRIDEDNMNALSVLCQNECENVFDESSEEFHDFRINTEEQFYRGDKVKWWNFYFSEKPTSNPFIRRDKYKILKQMIRSQTKDPTSTCVVVNLFHHPGCGGTTLAMHVMWNLRKEFRCAVLKDNNIEKSEVAQQVGHLMRCGKTENSLKTPVLLLVEDSEETENTQELQNCIRKVTDELSSNALVIILNCLRSKNPKLRYNNSVTGSQYITAALSKDEQVLFETKFEDLKKNHQKPDNFYSFMIMKSNFSQKYVAKVAHNILKDFDIESKEAKLLSILAVLNCYVAESAISVSLCEQFLGINNIRLWGTERVLKNMEPYSCLLIEFSVQELGVYKVIRFVHQCLAEATVKELESSHGCSPFNTALDILHCDLFFKTGMGIDSLMQSVKSMLITRQRKTEGDEKDTLFSPFIEDIFSSNNELKKVEEIFTIASERFDKDFAIPQALARYYYLHGKNFEEAKKWAEKAIQIKANSYTLDTVGQVSRTELRHKYESYKKENKALTSANLKECLDIAISATKAFQRAQKLEKSDIADVEDEPQGRSRTYNISGYVGEIDVAITVFDIVRKLPLFDDRDPMKNHYFGQFFKGRMSIINIPIIQNETIIQLVAILKDYENFLGSLKSQVDKSFDFLEIYFTHTRAKGLFDKEKESRYREKISEHFKTYISLFCNTPEKQKLHKPKLSLNMEIDECRMFLEENRANTFPRILQYLENSGDMIQQMAEKHSFIYKNSTTKTTKDKINHLLAKIVLRVISPNSKGKNVKELSDKEIFDLLHEILQEVGTQHPYPEPYYLAVLLLWPERKEIDKHIITYVNAMKNSSKKQHSHLYRTRNTIPHFFLGKSDGLQRLIPKVTLDRDLGRVRERNVLWQTGEIFREQSITSQLLRVHGTIEQGEIFAEYGKLRIPVRPTFLGRLRSGHSTERVSFYIGFAIDGPLTYDIQYENEGNQITSALG